MSRIRSPGGFTFRSVSNEFSLLVLTRVFPPLPYSYPSWSESRFFFSGPPPEILNICPFTRVFRSLLFGVCFCTPFDFGLPSLMHSFPPYDDCAETSCAKIFAFDFRKISSSWIFQVARSPPLLPLLSVRCLYNIPTGGSWLVFLQREN